MRVTDLLNSYRGFVRQSATINADITLFGKEKEVEVCTFEFDENRIYGIFDYTFMNEEVKAWRYVNGTLNIIIEGVAE